LCAGSEFRNFLTFGLGWELVPPDLDLVRFELYRRTLLVLVASWPVICANTQCYIWSGKPPTDPGEPPFPYSGFQMPWIVYLDAATAARVPAPPGIETESVTDGGRLLIVTRDRFDPYRTEHRRLSRTLVETLLDHGVAPPTR
jgi:hypothetical protein